jgi:tetratricopeptide (TPR) repeat protein
MMLGAGSLTVVYSFENRCKQGKLNESLDTCKKSLTISQIFPSYYTCSTVGENLYDKKGFKNVMDFYRQLTADIPKQRMADLYYDLGSHIQYDEAEGKKEEAIAAFRQSLQLYPEHNRSQESLKELLENK